MISTFSTMATRVGKNSDLTNSPLYQDLFEFIDVMGIKQTKVIEAFGIGRSYWYKLKQQHLNGITLEHMHNFATYFGMPTEKVMSLCYMTYLRGISSESPVTVPPVDTSQDLTKDLDADFPPIN